MATCSCGASADRMGDFWDPMLDPRVLFYPHPEQGRTDVAAAVNSGTNLASADWSKTNVSGTTATQMITDAATGNFRVFQTVPGLQANHAANIYFEATAGTLTHLSCQDGTNSAVVHVDDGTVHSQTGCAATYLGLVGGRRAFSVAFPSWSAGPAQLRFYACDATGALSWTSAGGDTINVFNISPKQTQVSAHANALGGSFALAQATAANRPDLLNLGGTPWTGGRAMHHTDGVNDYEQGTFALGGPTSITVLWCGNYAAAYAAPDYIFDAKTANGMACYRIGAGQFRIKAGATSFDVSMSDELNVHTYGIAFTSNGTTYAYRDGVLSGSGLIGVLSADGLTVAALANGTYPGALYFRQKPILYSGVGDAVLMQRFDRWCRRGGRLVP